MIIQEYNQQVLVGQILSLLTTKNKKNNGTPTDEMRPHFDINSNKL